MKLTLSKFARFAWGVVGYNLFVILFGAFVRASGSGAGCGAHWPLCNGVVIPRPQQIETVIEFSHRITSGLAFLLVVGLLVWAWRSYRRGSLLRVTSAAAMFFMVTEALVGAGLVLFELVADNDSVARAYWMMAHLINTFLLIGFLSLTAWWASTGVPGRLRLRGLSGGLLLAGVLAILLLGASGAVTALGDTLFPAESLAHGIAQDFSAEAHWLIRMRIYHPAIAVSVGIYLFLATAWVRRRVQDALVERFTNLLFGLYVAQIILGLVNVALLAPIWMQLVHLLVSNLVWISFVLLGASVFGRPLAADAGSPARLNDHPVHHGVNQAKEVG